MQNPTERPAESLDSIYRRTDVTPEEFFQALGRLRRAARDEIERLIEWLDSTIDCDEDMAVDDEPCDGEGDDEPSLGSFDCMSNQIKAWRTTGCGVGLDAEVDDCDREPILATPEDMNGSQDQTLWEYGSRKDLEDDAGDNPELDPGENGIADLDGMREQWAGSPWLPVGEAVL